MTLIQTLGSEIHGLFSHLFAASGDELDDAHLLEKYPHVATMSDEEIHLAAESHLAGTDAHSMHVVSASLRRLRDEAKNLAR